MKRKNLWIGCGLVLALIVLVAFVGSAVVVKGCSDVVQGGRGAGPAAAAAASTDPRVDLEVGGIVGVTELPGFQGGCNNSTWTANPLVDVQGQTGHVIYSCTATKEQGEDDWTIVEAAMILDDQSVVILDPPVVTP